MPVSNKDLGKYKRPGIFINEIDQSIIELPIQEVLINLVPGFSKKGPINKPVRIDSPADFESTYGPVDKNLENKGSYFHRTVLDMLQKGPIWALNLLKTDPNRDLLQWESISVSSQYDNGPKNTAPYERFFNRQDFWERDTESFMDIVDEEFADNPINQPDPSHDILHLTNMGDKKFTLFMFKSAITGFDVTAESWYNGADKVPLFMNPKDYISDYMISVLAVYGDWTDYVKLSTDPYWGTYFNTKGLIKSNIQDFVNDRLVNVVAYYDVSLIPNFKDMNGRDLYIKNVINSSTEKTGIFCYYNEDALLNADYPKGAIDLIGSTLVGTDKKSLNFMSYKGTFSEILDYEQTYLDSPGNVFGNYAVNMISTPGWLSGRTAAYTNWYTNIYPELANGVNYNYTYKINAIDSSTGVLTTNTSIVSGTTEIGDVIYFNRSFGIIDSLTPYYIINTGNTSITISGSHDGDPLSGITSSGTTNTFIYSIKNKLIDDVSGYTYQIGETQYQLNSEKIFFSPFVLGSGTSSGTTQSRIDVVYLSTDSSTSHVLTGTASVGTTPSAPNYLLSNENTIILCSIKHTWNDDETTSYYTGVTTTSSGYRYYQSMDDYTILCTTTSTSLILTFQGTSGSTIYSDYDKLRLQKVFAEMESKILLGKSAIINYKNGYKYNIDDNYFIFESTTTENAKIVIYFDGVSYIPADYCNNGKFIIYYVDNEFVLPTGVSAKISTIMTTEKPVYPMTGLGIDFGVAAKYSNFYLGYYNGEINNLDWFYKNNDTGETTNIYYLKMYIDENKNLITQFLLNDPTSDPVQINPLNWPLYDYKLSVHSDKENMKQTLEIENYSSITDLTNTYYIYVDKTRYSEITKGWYLEGYYDTSYYDAPGQGYLNGEQPRKLVKIINTVGDTVNTSLKILYADGPIKIWNNSGSTLTPDYQTTAYKSIDNYFDEYYGVTLDPFVIHPDSIPNGTDARLDSIMSVIDKSTNLAKGLVNKNRITWRYLVDSFGLGLTSNSKQEYVDLCGAKLNCLGFINMPSVRQFKTSINPSFINDDRTINTEYIKEGGNPDLNPNFLYSFGNGVGMSTVGYFFPYVKDVNDNTKFIPPAAKAAKAYMAKFTGELGSSYPWQIIAGPQFSKIKDISATEMRFTNEDLENFYAMGANPIVYSLNRGYNINSESTAQVFPISSLSYMHSREVLIELENRLYDMLLNYHWRFNTPEIRAEIKFRADQICKELLDTNALYDFKNVCDKTNNTDYIIDLQMGVLDTYVEIIKGMGIIVNNITILKKGTISSKGFSPA